MRQTKSAVTCAMHQLLFCHGLTTFFLAYDARFHHSVGHLLWE